MNTSPETWTKDLFAEQALSASTRPPERPDMQADWRLRQELQSLPGPTLPADLRDRILAQTTQSTHRLPLAKWLGLAGAISLTLGVALLQNPSEPPVRQAAISDDDLHQLQLALSTLDDSARRAGRIAGRELATRLTVPMPQLDDMPYGAALRHWMQQPQRSPESDS